MGFFADVGGLVRANLINFSYILWLAVAFYIGVKYFWGAASSSLSPAMRKGLRWLFAAIVISVMLVIASYAVISGMKGADMQVTPVRALGFVDSVLAGIISFILLGAFAFIASLRRPHEESISDRISYLYSAKLDEGEAVMQFVTSQLLVLGASIDESETHYRFVDYDPVHNALRVNVIVSMTIVNMMRHDTYKQKLPINVSFDSVDGKEGRCGRVLRVETTKIGGGGEYSEVVSHIESPVNVPPSPDRYSGNIDLEISPNGKLKYLYEYEGWVKGRDNFWTGVNRFARRVSLKATNLTECEVKIKRNDSGHKRLRFKDIKEDLVSLPSSSIYFHTELNLEPGCPLTFSTEVVVGSSPSVDSDRCQP